MPTENLTPNPHQAQNTEQRQTPEPTTRIVRREIVRDRRCTKRNLRELADEWPASRFPQHVAD